MMERCPICGAPMEGNVCGYCGYRYEPAGVQNKAREDRRREYRREYRQEASGSRTRRTDTERSGAAFPVSTKSRWLAFILCFFFGKFGIHRFYAGKIGTGLLWLFTFGFFGIGWLVDLILIGVGAFEDSGGLRLYY